MRQTSTLHQTQEFIECVLLAEVKTRHGFKKAFGNGTNFSARQTRLIFHLGGATQPPELLNEIGRSGIPSLQLIRRWHLPQTHELPSGHCNRISRHSSHSFHRVVVTIIRYKVQLLKISINQKLVKLSAVTHISKILAKERGPEKKVSAQSPHVCPTYSLQQRGPGWLPHPNAQRAADRPFVESGMLPHRLRQTDLEHLSASTHP